MAAWPQKSTRDYGHQQSGRPGPTAAFLGYPPHSQAEGSLLSPPAHGILPICRTTSPPDYPLGTVVVVSVRPSRRPAAVLRQAHTPPAIPLPARPPHSPQARRTHCLHAIQPSACRAALSGSAARRTQPAHCTPGQSAALRPAAVSACPIHPSLALAPPLPAARQPAGLRGRRDGRSSTLPLTIPRAAGVVAGVHGIARRGLRGAARGPRRAGDLGAAPRAGGGAAGRGLPSRLPCMLTIASYTGTAPAAQATERGWVSAGLEALVGSVQRHGGRVSRSSLGAYSPSHDPSHYVCVV
jgi:hypothetical protein